MKEILESEDASVDSPGIRLSHPSTYLEVVHVVDVGGSDSGEGRRLNDGVWVGCRIRVGRDDLLRPESGKGGGGVRACGAQHSMDARTQRREYACPSPRFRSFCSPVLVVDIPFLDIETKAGVKRMA